MSSPSSIPSSSITDVEASKKENEQPQFDEKAAFKVDCSDNDPLNPHNFSTLRKYWLTSQFALLAFVGSFGAAIISPAQGVIVDRFHISAEASVLTVSLFVLGYAVGPMVWAPIGEVYGRKISMIPPVFILGLFSIGTAVSNNAAAILVTRFFGGLFASAPNANASAAIGDFFDARSRGIPMSLMALCIVGGPCLAPVVGAALVVNPHLGWRWTMYIQAIISFAASVITAIALPETYGPVLLKRKAKQLRQSTGDDRYWHPQELERMNLNRLLTKYISRPAR